MSEVHMNRGMRLHESTVVGVDLEADNQALRAENERLTGALERSHLELAALIPDPKHPTVADFFKVCCNENEADADCMYLAYTTINAALHPERGKP